jgi:CRP-like cAMP-binding protein
MNTETIYDAIRHTRLATELNDQQCRRLAGVMTLVDLKDREVLVREGTTDDHVYLVVEGTLGVVKSAGSADETAINALSSGDFAGELAWLDHQQRFASLIAQGPTRVIGLARAQLETLLDTDAVLVYHVMLAIVRAVHQIQVRLSMQQSELSNYIYKQHGRY